MATGGFSYRMVNVFCRGFGPIVLGSVSLACGLTTLPAHAQESAAPVTFDIPSQPLARALNSWAVQAGAQLFFERFPAAGLTSPAFSGSRAPREALHTLLANSGLDFTQTEEGVFIVRPVVAQRGARGASERVYLDSRHIVLGNPELAQRHIDRLFIMGDESAFRDALRQGLHLQEVRNPIETTLVLQ